jgi:hypothetical protein
MVLIGACGDDDSTKTTPTAAAQSPSGTSAATNTAATKTATPPADGTVDPLGGGQQTPWTVKGSTDPFPGVATVDALRTGLHPELGGWERIVFEFAGPDRPPGVVQYVDKAVSCGSGQTVTTQGTAILEIAFTSAQAHNNSGQPTIPNTLPGPGGTVIIGGVSSCDFEGHVTWDFGLNGKHNFKVSTLTGPTRIVIDIKQ